MRTLMLPLVASLVLIIAPGCAGNANGSQQNNAQSGATPPKTADAAAAIPASMQVPTGTLPNPADPLDKGWFTFSSVVDGDTFWVLEAQESLRLLCIDSEETVKTAEDRAASQLDQLDWEQTVAKARASKFLETRLIPKAGVNAGDLASRWQKYTADMRKGAGRPVKFGTPYGNLAKEYAVWFFEEADVWDGNKDGKVMVRLEIDDLKRQVDIYGRYLVYSFVKGPDGQELNFHVEQVRVGMAPYFPKYGHSIRYKKDFEAAQREAQQAKRGIWSDDWGHYPDYDERLAWWNERGDTLYHFATNYGQNPDYFDLASPSELVRLRARVGDPVTVYGLIESIRGRSDPATITLATGDDSIKFPISVPSTVAIATEDKQWKEHYVYARGTIIDKNGSLQMEVADESGIWVEPAHLAELYASGKSKDFGEREMAQDVLPATDKVAAAPAAEVPEITTDPETGLKVIPWQRAEEFENQGEFIVEGVVHSAKIAGKVAFINFHADFKNTFSIFIPPTSLGAFSNQFAGFPDDLIGKKVRIRGTIIHFDKNGQDKAEIVAEDPAKLTVLE